MNVFSIPNGCIKVVLPREQRKRLHGTCFRGKQVREAGNFSRWSGFDQMLDDPIFGEPFLEIVNDILLGRKPLKGHGFKERIGLKLSTPIGWSSTIPRELAPGGHLERRSLNHQAEALFQLDPSCPAPLTNVISLALGFKCPDQADLTATVLIETLYPGPNVGRLVGDVTEATGHVFFDFHHPGGDKLIELEP